MAAFINDDILDLLLDGIGGATALHVISGATAPAVLADVTGARSLATVTLDSGDVAQANHATSGRQVTIAAQSGVTVTANAGAGTAATYYCLVDGTDLLAFTEVDSGSPSLTSGSTVNIPAVIFSVADPTVV